METLPCSNYVAGHQIATNFCTCHDSTAVVPCTKFCSDHCIRIEMRVKRNFHRIRIAMEKPLVKRGPGLQFQLWRQPGARALRRRRLCHLSRGRRRHSRKRAGAGTPSSRRVKHLIRHSRCCLLRADSGKPEASQHRLPATTPWRDPAQPASARLRVGGGCTLP